MRFLSVAKKRRCGREVMVVVTVAVVIVGLFRYSHGVHTQDRRKRSASEKATLAEHATSANAEGRTRLACRWFWSAHALPRPTRFRHPSLCSSGPCCLIRFCSPTACIAFRACGTWFSISVMLSWFCQTIDD